jgi:zinc transporter 7
MASRFMPSRRMGFALIAGCLLFSALAAATASPADLSVGEIEEQLQVIQHELGST